ncbi:MAG TPA: FkbM family methyltransferase [Candidatus Acidoferrum sp.]|nr:FkbM family methyltransferase [Candidatus Acidoferrum sp.]
MFEISPRWEVHLWEGDYELAVQQILVDRLMVGTVFYDVGAGFGFYSSLAARLGARVFAFEPDEENSKSLRRHSELNGLTAKIEIMRLAVLATSGLTHFEPARQERGHGNGRVSEGRGQAITVHCTSLDDFAGLNPLPNLIKIDVEGSESDVLRGAEHLFDRCRPSVICEVHDAANALFVSNWLKKKRYSVEYIGNRGEYPVHMVATAQR